MNDQERLEQQINDQIGLIDRFAHPVVSRDLTDRITRGMVRESHRRRIFPWVVRLVIPAATAAGLLLAFALWTPATLKTRPPTPTPGATVSSPISFWSLGMEDGVKAVFADLDFYAAASQPTPAGVNETEDLIDKYLIEAFNST